MATKVGNAIKEARTAAGLTPEELAEKVDGVSAEDICQAECGEKKLSQNKLKAIAKATGVTQKSLLDAAKEDAAAAAAEEAPACDKKEEAPCECDKKEETPAEEPAELTDTEVLDLYKTADADTQKAAVSALKGDGPNAQNPLISALAGVLGGGNPDNPITALLNSEKGGEIVNSIVSMVGGFISKKIAEKQGEAEKQSGEENK